MTEPQVLAIIAAIIREVSGGVSIEEAITQAAKYLNAAKVYRE